MLVISVAVANLAAPPRAQASEAGCSAILRITNNRERVSARIAVSVVRCGSPDELGDVRLNVSLSREGSPAITVDKTCGSAAACSAELVIGHPLVEFAYYYLDYSYETTGSVNIGGFGWTITPCRSVGLYAFCGTSWDHLREQSEIAR